MSKKLVLDFNDLSIRPSQEREYFVLQACYDKEKVLIGYEFGFSLFSEGAWVRIDGADGSYADVAQWCQLPHPRLLH